MPLTPVARPARSVLLAAVLTPAALVLTGCIGGDSPVGAVGVHLDDGGRVVAVVAACGERVEQVELVRLDEDDVEAEDPTVGRWTTAEGAAELVLADPGAGWTVDTDAGTLDPDALYDLGAGYVDTDRGTTDAQFRPRDLAGLQPGQVMTRQQEVMTVDGLREWACEDA